MTIWTWNFCIILGNLYFMLIIKIIWLWRHFLLFWWMLSSTSGLYIVSAFNFFQFSLFDHGTYLLIHMWVKICCQLAGFFLKYLPQGYRINCCLACTTQLIFNLFRVMGVRIWNPWKGGSWWLMQGSWKTSFRKEQLY